MEKSLEIGREDLVEVKVIGLHWVGVKDGKRGSKGSGTEQLDAAVREKGSARPGYSGKQSVAPDLEVREV